MFLGHGVVPVKMFPASSSRKRISYRFAALPREMLSARNRPPVSDEPNNAVVVVRLISRLDRGVAPSRVESRLMSATLRKYLLACDGRKCQPVTRNVVSHC